MDDNNQQTGQQGYGQDEDPTRAQGQQPNEQQRNAQPIGGNDSNSGSGTTMTSGSSTGEAGASATGQASYGNSGETDTEQSQNSPSLGQESDMGQTPSPEQSGFISSGNSADDTGSADGDMNRQGASSDQSGASGFISPGSPQQDGSAEQDFASQGQGAIDSENLAGKSKSDSHGTDDIEVERSQGREQGIDASSM